MYFIFLGIAFANNPSEAFVEMNSCQQAQEWFEPFCNGNVIIDCFESYDGMPEVSGAYCSTENETVAMESRIGEYWDALTLGVREVWDRNFGCYTCDDLAAAWTKYCRQHGLFVGGFMCVEDWWGCAEDDAKGQCTSSYEESVVLSPDDW